MQIRQLKVEQFRGIRSFDWRPRSTVTCLIGPCDSTKTTILDAIELVLSPRWSVSISDADFHQGKYERPIVITATIGQLPASLLAEDKYGMDLGGWTEGSGLKDEPEGDDESVLTIRFSVDESLEPTWLVVNERRPEGRPIAARDREALGVVRLGGDIDRHLSWGRGSALARNTDALEEVGRVVAAAQREARQAVATADLAKLKAAAANAKKAALAMGVAVVGEYRPALDALAATGAGQLSLHEGEIPVRAAGLGTKRLTALALQSMAVKEGTILLIDEVEHGLEPHRLRHLLRRLRATAEKGQGQVFMTTHSPIPIVELEAEELCVTRSGNGQTRVRRVAAELQDIVRKAPEALLGRRVLVCEGKTELGLCRALESRWANARKGIPSTHTGTVLIHGSGSEAAEIGLKVRRLGYATALLVDSDRPLSVDVRADLAKVKAKVIEWDGGVATEERVAIDLPWSALQEVVDLAISLRSEQSVSDAVKARLPSGSPLSTARIEAWRKLGYTADQIRQAIGKAAKHGAWFKRIDLGEELGEIIARALPSIPGSDLAKRLAQVASWVYDE